MEIEVVIIKPAELILKSKGVRKQFEKRLLFNVKDCLKKKEIEFDQVIRGHGRYFIYTPEPEEVVNAIKNVFGISNIYAAAQVGAKISSIKSAIYDLVEDLNITSKNTFGVRANTVNTDIKSRKIETEIGAFIQEKTKAKVNLRKPDFWLRTEVVGSKAFIFSEIIQGLGGLPLGTGGKVISLISDNERDILASWMIMRRGAEIIPLHLRSDEKKLNNAQKNIKKLEKFAWGSKIKSISIKQDKDMKKNLKKLVEQTGAKAYIFGDIEIHPRKADLPIFEPLIGLDKKELKALEKIVL
jgi:tRNA uracil 4-sulfurtransferase